MKKIINSSLLVLAAIVFLLGIYINGRTDKAIGSVAVGNDYNATTTEATWTLARRIKSGPGSLGSVIVTNTGATSPLTIYDATTTDILGGRAASMSTTSVTIAKFPVGTTAGTYTFDVDLRYGLIVETSTGGTGVASTTITWR